ncbi:hypothetical protein M1D51_21530 [Arthrobacter sp. R3-55]
MDNINPTVATLCLIAVAAVHRFILSNRRQKFLGAIIPILWLVAAVILAANGILSGPGAWISAGVVMVGLLVIWWSGQVSYRKRLDSENARIDSVNASRSLR